MSLDFSTLPFYFNFLIFSSLAKFGTTNDIRKYNFLTLRFFNSRGEINLQTQK